MATGREQVRPLGLGVLAFCSLGVKRLEVLGLRAVRVYWGHHLHRLGLLTQTSRCTSMVAGWKAYLKRFEMGVSENTGP